MSTGLAAISPHPEHPMTTHVPPDLAARLVALRHDLHAFPELAFEETRTAGVAARELAALGLKVTTGLAGTGVVGTAPSRRRPGHRPSGGHGRAADPRGERRRLCLAHTRHHACLRP